MSVWPTSYFGIADPAQLSAQMENSSANSGRFLVVVCFVFYTPALLITSRTKQNGAVVLQPVVAEHLSC